MDNFQIETAQNISITQNAAGVGERILAFLIDAVIMVVYIILVNLLLSGFEGSMGEQWVFYLVVGLPLFLYFLIWETFWDGRSPGKAALELRVVKIDGSKPAFSNYLVRWLLRIVDVTLTGGSVAVITILFNGKGQRLGDVAAATTVISEKEKFGLDDTLLMDLPGDYEPRYPQATVLTDQDVQDIKMLYSDAVKNGNREVLKSLSGKVAGLLDVDPAEKPSIFIKTVLKDYSYFTQQ